MERTDGGRSELSQRQYQTRYVTCRRGGWADGSVTGAEEVSRRGRSGGTTGHNHSRLTKNCRSSVDGDDGRPSNMEAAACARQRRGSRASAPSGKARFPRILPRTEQWACWAFTMGACGESATRRPTGQRSSLLCAACNPPRRRPTLRALPPPSTIIATRPCHLLTLSHGSGRGCSADCLPAFPRGPPRAQITQPSTPFVALPGPPFAHAAEPCPSATRPIYPTRCFSERWASPFPGVRQRPRACLRLYCTPLSLAEGCMDPSI